MQAALHLCFSKASYKVAGQVKFTSNNLKYITPSLFSLVFFHFWIGVSGPARENQNIKHAGGRGSGARKRSLFWANEDP